MPMPPLRLQMMSPPQTTLEAALRACAGSLGLVFAYSCSYNLLLLAPSIYLLQIYDRVLSSHSADTLVMLTLIVAFTVIVGGVLDALRRAAMGRIGAWLEDRLGPDPAPVRRVGSILDAVRCAMVATLPWRSFPRTSLAGGDRRGQCDAAVWPRICR